MERFFFCQKPALDKHRERVSGCVQAFSKITERSSSQTYKRWTAQLESLMAVDPEASGRPPLCLAHLRIQRILSLSHA